MLKLIESSPDLPVSLDLAKGYLKIDHDLEDALLRHLILAATTWVEEACGKTLTKKTWEFTQRRKKVFLPNPPVLKILEVKFRGNVLREEQYDFFDRNGRPGIDVTMTSREGLLSVRYVVGYGDNPEDIPPTLKNTILTTLAYLYENRGEQKGQKNGLEPPPWIEYHRNYHLI